MSMVVVAVCSTITTPTVTRAIWIARLLRSANDRDWGTTICAGMARAEYAADGATV